MPRVRAIVFDAGETLFDETRLWESWADWLAIPRLTFMATLGGLIARGQNHNEVFEVLRPGIDLGRERKVRMEKGDADEFRLRDLYPDALPALKSLKNKGYKIGVVGNQRSGTTSCLSEADVELDLLTTSEDLGFEKPDIRFFQAVAEELRAPPSEVAYVGDRQDNDVGPAVEAELFAVFLRRGPWALIQSATEPPPEQSIDSLMDLHDLLERH
jgi:HAD superfamily hydrolase (TIGR01549 family)